MRLPVVKQVILLAVGVLLLAACKPEISKEYIQPDEMEDLLYDYYVAQGLPTKTGSKEEIDYGHEYHTSLVLKKYGRTQAELDSSMRYYYINMEELQKIMLNVKKRLSDKALELGASTVEVERFTSQSLSGDTTEVWEGSRQMVLLPQAPYNIQQFSLKADTSYHQGDSFLMTFGNTFLVQSGTKNAWVVLSVRYENDSIITHHTNISMGTTTLRVPPCKLKAKELRGYVYMPKLQVSDNENDMCVLLLDHIQLVRFHNKRFASTPDKETVTALDTLKKDTLKKDTLKNDSLKPRQRRLGERPLPENSIKLDNYHKAIKPLTKNRRL